MGSHIMVHALLLFFNASYEVLGGNENSCHFSLELSNMKEYLIRYKENTIITRVVIFTISIEKKNHCTNQL